MVKRHWCKESYNKMRVSIKKTFSLKNKLMLINENITERLISQKRESTWHSQKIVSKVLERTNSNASNFKHRQIFFSFSDPIGKEEVNLLVFVIFEDTNSGPPYIHTVPPFSLTSRTSTAFVDMGKMVVCQWRRSNMFNRR